MEATRNIVHLLPIGVELIDRTLIELAREIPIFRPTLDKFVRETPEAILLVEFGEPDHEENLRRLQMLKATIGDLGFAWDKQGDKWGGVVEVLSPELQAAITEVRTSGLNIMMSMKQEGKPVSFVEDCAVPLEHLADYTSRLTQIFEKHGTRGTWYAHAGSGCLHVRPVLNLRLDKDVHAMREIAEEAFAMVREYKGSHSGEHGDGLVRSEFNEPMFGSRLARAFEEVKDRFDPQGPLQSGQGGAAAEIRRPFAVPLRARISWRGCRHASRLVGVSRQRRRVPGRGRDVQQQRRLPETFRRRHVPELSRHPRRARRHPRPRQYAAPRRHRPARPRCAGLAGNGGDAEAVRLLQGLPARVPDRRRHGAHEDRGAGGARREARAFAARPAGRLSAALRGEGRAGTPGSPICATARRPCATSAGYLAGFARQAQPAAMARGYFPRPLGLVLRRKR